MWKWSRQARIAVGLLVPMDLESWSIGNHSLQDVSWWHGTPGSDDVGCGNNWEKTRVKKVEHNGI